MWKTTTIVFLCAYRRLLKLDNVTFNLKGIYFVKINGEIQALFESFVSKETTCVGTKKKRNSREIKRIINGRSGRVWAERIEFGQGKKEYLFMRINWLIVGSAEHWALSYKPGKFKLELKKEDYKKIPSFALLFALRNFYRRSEPLGLLVKYMKSKNYHFSGARKVGFVKTF